MLQRKPWPRRSNRREDMQRIDTREVTEQYLAGRSLQSLGREYTITVRLVREMLELTGTPIRRRGPLPKPPKTSGEQHGRQVVYARSEGWCEARINRFCAGLATEWHHRKNRSQYGTWQPSNGLHLCAICHHSVTFTNGQRGEYERTGWIVPSTSDPAAIPVLHSRAGWVYLGDDGGLRKARGDAA
jgi:hypothetical protein